MPPEVQAGGTFELVVHVEIAGAMGLGEWNESKIDIRRIRL